MSEPIKVLIVDDNKRYREAFSRNLVVQGMQVVQAEDGEQALSLLRTQSPDVMVTDLQMRTATEGLDVIRDALAQDPCLPIIMISAVGSFDEGALASKLGAAHVLSKSRIEEDITALYDSIRESHVGYRASHAALQEIAAFRNAEQTDGFDIDQTLKRLQEIKETEGLHPYVKSEAFDLIASLSQVQLKENNRKEVETALRTVKEQDLQSVVNSLKESIPLFDDLDPDTQESLRMAEYLFQHIDSLGSMLELTRTSCFSYCFSVENQAKSTIRKRLTKFLSQDGTIAMVRSLLEKGSNHVDMFFQQHILQTMRNHRMDFSIDNIRQTFLRVLEHQSKYRPDGLKAVGIFVLTFGRTYEFKQMAGIFKMDNPMGIKGLDNDEEVLRFVELLVSLQHMRNPYIHPEISGKEGIGKIRDMVVECLNLLGKLK